MIQDIYAITNYKGHFETKYRAVPYRSGMDKQLLSDIFQRAGYRLIFLSPHTIDFRTDWNGKYVIYTSSEDNDYRYKSFLEDLVYGLHLSGAHLIPDFRYMKANNNKVVMEILRDILIPGTFLPSYKLGTLEEANMISKQLPYPVVIKRADGALGKGVYKALNAMQFIQVIKRVSRNRLTGHRVKDLARKWRHAGYMPDSGYRQKFIIQPFIPGLVNDWKVYFFAGKAFVFYRPVLKRGDFRASGGGYENYLYGKEAQVTDALLEYASDIFMALDTPSCSLDIAYDGEKYYLMEFQTVFFGKAGVVRSKEYYYKENERWIASENSRSIEEVYAGSIVSYINRKKSVVL